MSKHIFIIEDDTMMQECIARAVTKSSASSSAEIYCFSDAVTAMAALDQRLPDLIFLDILLNGPDGFSFLNELVSYVDTNRIPIVVITSLNLSQAPLSSYNVVKVLSKDSMLPSDIMAITSEVLNYA